MASLKELKKIYDDTFKPITDPDPDVALAHELLGELEVAVWRRANWYLDDPDHDTTDAKVNVAWASRAAENSDAMARGMLRLLLGSIAAKNQPVDQIFTRTDDQIETAVDRMIPLLSTGLMISR